MENCFVKTLKGEMSDVSVERFNIISLYSTADSNHNQVDYFKFYENGKSIFETDQETEVSFYNGSGSVIFTTPQSLEGEGATYTTRTIGEQHFVVDGVNNIKEISIGNVGTVPHLYLGVDSRKLSIFGKIPFEILTLRRQTGITGTLEELVADKTNIKELFLTEYSNSIISGNILSLANNLLLTKFIMYYWSSGHGYEYDLSLKGDIAELADLMVENGRTSGKMQIDVHNTDCTNSNSGKLITYINFTDDTTTYPRGWYETDS